VAGLSGLTGLKATTGLYGPVDDQIHGSTVRDPANWGGPVDPRHHIPGDSSREPDYAGTPYPPPAPQIIAVQPGLSRTPGHLRDQTPRSHAAPYPRGIQTDPVLAADASAILHGADLGGTTYLNDAAIPYPVQVENRYDLSPNQSGLAAAPDQLRGLSTDTDQGFGHDNAGTFGYGHQQQRIYHDPIPFDTTTLYAGDRPFYGKHPVWQNRLDGDGSPYAQAGDISTGMNLGPTPVGYPTAYQQPPDPTVAPYTGYASEAPSAGADWIAG
jgi:hypothetical protein